MRSQRPDGPGLFELADPAATRADRVHAAETEQAVHHLYLQRPGADAELQAEAELEAAT